MQSTLEQFFFFSLQKMNCFSFFSHSYFPNTNKTDCCNRRCNYTSLTANRISQRNAPIKPYCVSPLNRKYLIFAIFNANHTSNSLRYFWNFRWFLGQCKPTGFFFNYFCLFSGYESYFPDFWSSRHSETPLILIRSFFLIFFIRIFFCVDFIIRNILTVRTIGILFQSAFFFSFAIFFRSWFFSLAIVFLHTFFFSYAIFFVCNFFRS